MKRFFNPKFSPGQTISYLKFEELWYTDPGDTVLVDDTVYIVGKKYVGDAIQFVDAEPKEEQ
ncbi:MAG: hypothetical protein DDT19_00261 [Syntrophomonadaceae bacterium]|nr:hypothetical protein [Bacillota bacterium]